MPRGNLDIDLMAFINPCPLIPSTLMVSCSNPASARMPDSIFLPALMKMILDPGYLDKISLPTATPGNRCPPVPPPAIITLIPFLPLFSVSIIGSLTPYTLHLPPCRDTQQYTYTQQTDYQRRSSIAEQRESQSLGGQQTHYNAHIYNDLESDHCADAHTQIAAVKIRCVERYLDPPYYQNTEEHYYRDYA